MPQLVEKSAQLLFAPLVSQARRDHYHGAATAGGDAYRHGNGQPGFSEADFIGDHNSSLLLEPLGDPAQRRLLSGTPHIAAIGQLAYRCQLS
jgi:hypothetical protein